MRYILFVKETCPFCVSAVDMLEKKGQDYNTGVFGSDQLGTLEEMKKAYDWATVPMIFKRDGSQIEFIGGFTELMDHLQSVGERR